MAQSDTIGINQSNVSQNTGHIVRFAFDATLNTGPLAGTQIDGRGSYDASNVTGIGQEFAPLTSLNFTLDGVRFTLHDIVQGRQAFLDNGVLSQFDAAFFPPPPQGLPVSGLVFGFGQPNEISYGFPANMFAGGSVFVVEPPEPAGHSHAHAP